MKGFAAVLAVALLLLQYRLWFSSAGISEVLHMRSAVAAQQAENERLSERNRQLSAEVRDLKQGFDALEERARSDLGMIASNETFFQIVPGDAGIAPAGESSVSPGQVPAPRATPSVVPPGAHTAQR